MEKKKREKFISEGIDDTNKLNIKTEINRNELTLQGFLNDMQMVGLQLRDRKLVKPTFNFGDSGVTNYLLWLLYGELLIHNQREEKNGI